MEKMPFSTHHASSPSTPNTPRKDRRDSPQQVASSRKLVVEHLERMRKLQLQKQLEERQVKLTKYLQQKQEGIQRETALKHTKSTQWFQNVKAKNKISAFGCPQLVERDPNAIGKDKKEIQAIYFNKKNANLRKSKHKHNKMSTYIDSLPSIGKETPQGRADELDLMDFGIFTAQENMEGFLRHFRSTLMAQFKGGVDLSNIFNLNRLQYHLLRDINLEQ